MLDAFNPCVENAAMIFRHLYHSSQLFEAGCRERRYLLVEVADVAIAQEWHKLRLQGLELANYNPGTQGHVKITLYSTSVAESNHR